MTWQKPIPQFNRFASRNAFKTFILGRFWHFNAEHLSHLLITFVPRLVSLLTWCSFHFGDFLLIFGDKLPSISCTKLSVIQFLIGARVRHKFTVNLFMTLLNFFLECQFNRLIVLLISYLNFLMFSPACFSYSSSFANCLLSYKIVILDLLRVYHIQFTEFCLLI